ncbi:MAG: cytidylate kinase [Leucobacter sp.]|nr:cytidylate kinase [Leucobacter sp.]
MDDTVTSAAPLVTSPATSPILVAIDGPAGSGKSSVSREAATRLGFGILDTGAAYRALAWTALHAGADLDDSASMLKLVDAWRFDITLQGAQRVTVQVPQSTARPADGQEDAAPLRASASQRELNDTFDVTEAIRAPEISAQVSRDSRHPEVRTRLNAMFLGLVEHSGLAGVVIEGRDITTVVAPDAPVRVLLTASAETRAARRAGELPGLSAEQVLADLRARDAKDAQVVDFFNPAPGVTLIDTTDMNFEQSVQAVIDVVTAAQKAAREEAL